MQRVAARLNLRIKSGLSDIGTLIYSFNLKLQSLFFIFGLLKHSLWPILKAKAGFPSPSRILFVELFTKVRIEL